MLPPWIDPNILFDSVLVFKLDAFEIKPTVFQIQTNVFQIEIEINPNGEGHSTLTLCQR